MSTKQQRAQLGYQLFQSVKPMQERLTNLRLWMVSSQSSLGRLQMSVMAESGLAVALNTPFGRVFIAEELASREDKLVGRLVFYRKPSLFDEKPVRLCLIEIDHDGEYYFNGPEEDNILEWDSYGRGLDASNLNQLSYELAISLTQNPVASPCGVLVQEQ